MNSPSIAQKSIDFSNSIKNGSLQKEVLALNELSG
jgi:hypothetical protein